MSDLDKLNTERNDRILIIDDNEHIHKDFQKILHGDSESSEALNASRVAFFGADDTASKAEHFHIDSAYQGQQGYEMVCQSVRNSRPYAMAFVDVRMPPGWDGIETIKRIWTEYPELQVVICTAYSDYSWNEVIDVLGQSDKLLVLKKPFDNIEVRQLAYSLTEKWHLARQARAKLSEVEQQVARRTDELAKSESHMRAIIESAQDCIIAIDHQDVVTEFNPAAEATFGHPRAEVVGKRLSDVIVPPSYRDKHRQGLQNYLATGHGQMLGKRVELLAMRHDGSEIPVEATITAIRNDASPPTFTAILRDISLRKQVEEKLQHDASHDVLTGLPNRSLFSDRLEQAIARSKRNHEYAFAVLFLDLDRFKNINDSLGHLIGDKLLIETAQRLLKCVRPPDTVARLGGDEFAILVDDIANVQDAVRVAQRINKALAGSFDLDGERLFTTASIGIAISASGYDRPEEILRDADTAMYGAKSSGKACYHLFDSEMHARAMQTLDLDNNLRCAIERQEFRNYYQPIVSLKTGSIVAIEALLRWQHPERGLLSPSQFLKLAEDAGLMVPIGWWVLREACRQLRQWQEEIPEYAKLTMNVNFSPSQLLQPDLIEKIDRIVREFDLRPQSLALEVTEDTLIENTQLVAARLAEIKSMGIHICIDDFGTGYASLSYLHQFCFDTLKIDRSFIISDTDNEGSWHILEAIITLAHNLGMNVVAEGVETEAQCALLQEMNCEYAQGYLFTRPQDSDSTRAALVDSGRAVAGELSGA